VNHGEEKSTTINTEGGSVIESDVSISKGDFVGRDKTNGVVEKVAGVVIGENTGTVHVYAGQPVTKTSVKVGSTSVTLIVDGDFDNYSSQDEEKLLTALKFLLKLDSEVQIIKKERGSIQLTVALPKDKVAELVKAVKLDALEKFGVSDVLLINVDLSGTNLTGADLTGADLSEANLTGADLYRANLRLADLHGARLNKADLLGANLRGADLRGADLREADLGLADLREADLSLADLRGAILRGAILRGAILNRASFSGADLTGADLGLANLSGTNLSAAILNRAILNRAILSDADLFGANLSEADLSGADLSGADLSSADLRGAILNRTILNRTILSDADLFGADLSDADLSGAILSKANEPNNYMGSDVIDEALNIPNDRIERGETENPWDALKTPDELKKQASDQPDR
jgi:uncharacterized protein YjbI with pentapeptide repeats